MTWNSGFRCSLPAAPAFRGFADRVSGSMQFFDEVQGCFGAALLIPSDCALNICDRALVVLNTFSAHSPWPRTRDAVFPKGRSLPCPLSGPRFDVPLPHPKPLGQIHSYSRDCRAGCWLMQRARQRRGRARFRRSEISGLMALFYPM
jgi:hypothetical protein